MIARTTLALALPCRGCLVARVNGHTTCQYCGRAIPQGREPSERERYETSEQAREDRIQRIEDARRNPDEIDALVKQALEQHIEPTGEFTHDHLVQYTGLNCCAIKFALIRLAERGIVKTTGFVKIRANRSRPKWQFLMPIISLSAKPRGTIKPITNRFAKAHGIAKSARHPDRHVAVAH